MPVAVVLGAQWGDEGKGKVVDLLSREVDVVARYQGGANAGHTIAWADKRFVLHLIPSGIFREGLDCVIGNGVVVDPVALADEIVALRDKWGYNVDGRLHLSKGAHLILPYHKVLDGVRERARSQHAIGTTKRGIGPAYEDKVARVGLRAADLLDSRGWEKKVHLAVAEKNAVLQGVYGHTQLLDASEIVDQCKRASDEIGLYITDTTHLLMCALEEGKRVLAEGAQGALLDIDFGTYPYVTSSHPTVGGACTGLGVPPSAIDRVLGVTKAYTTRVGNGPFPTELEDDTGEKLRASGNEYGATTGRPRRCGWLDLVALRYATMINGITDLAITKLDVLSGLDHVRVCIGYQINGERVDRFPTGADAQLRATPIYETLPGWSRDIRGLRNYELLPEPARDLIKYIASSTGVRVSLVSTGPKRHETIDTDISP